MYFLSELLLISGSSYYAIYHMYIFTELRIYAIMLDIWCAILHVFLSVFLFGVGKFYKIYLCGIRLHRKIGEL